MIEGRFGTIIFGRARGRIMTFEEIERKYTGRFGTHMVHLRKPLLEWAGNDLVKIDMKVHLNASWCGNPLPILAEWHFSHENALAAPLVVGGKPMGPGLSLFCITEMVEAHKHWLAGGRLIAVELNIHFEEYIPSAEGPVFPQGAPGFLSGGTLGNVAGGVII
jgi:hypothetical protein